MYREYTFVAKSAPAASCSFARFQNGLLKGSTVAITVDFFLSIFETRINYT